MICATRAMGHIHTTTTNKAKLRIHAWLAAQPRPDLRFGNATALHMCGGSTRWYRKTQCARPQTSVCTARQADQRIFSNFGRRNLATPHRNLFRWPQIRSSGVIVRCHECFEPFFCPAQRHRSRGCLSLKLRWLLYSISTNCWSRSQVAKKSFNQLLYPSIR